MTIVETSANPNVEGGQDHLHRRLTSSTASSHHVRRRGMYSDRQPDWLPEKFDRSIPIDGWNRACRLRWKTTDRVGVAYV